jgi:hypothetical protein
VWADDGEVVRPGPGGALSGRREDVRPGIKHRHQVVAVAGIRHAEHDRLHAEVETTLEYRVSAFGLTTSVNVASGNSRRCANWFSGARCPIGRDTEASERAVASISRSG